MTIHLNSVQEEQLVAMSEANGMDVDVLAQQAIEQFLLYREKLEVSVREGREAADRGELLEHADVVTRIERLLVS